MLGASFSSASTPVIVSAPVFQKRSMRLSVPHHSDIKSECPLVFFSHIARLSRKLQPVNGRGGWRVVAPAAPQLQMPNANYGFFGASLISFPASVASACALLFTRFFSAFASLAARFDVLLMSCATLFSPPGCALCDP